MSQSAKQGSPQEGARRGRIGALGPDAQGLAAAAFRRAGFTDPALVLRWAEIAGPEIAAVAEPLKCQEGPEGAILTVSCEAGAAVLLQHQTRTLIGRLNAYLGPGRIARLRFVPGPLRRTPDLPNHPAASLPRPSLDGKAGLSGALERLADLRRLLPNRPVR